MNTMSVNSISVTRTVLQGDNSTQKEIRIPAWAHRQIRLNADRQNRRMTQGVVAYEILQMTQDSLTDDFDELEHCVDEKSKQEGIDPDDFGRIRFQRQDETRSDLKDAIDEDPNEKNRARLWIPVQVEKQADWVRGWGRRIADAVAYTASRPYNDRSERITVKQQVLAYAQDGTEPSNETARAIVGYDEDTDLYVPDSLQAAIDDDNINIDDWEDFYAEADNLTTWDERFEATEAVMDSVYKIQITSLYEKVFDISSSWAKKKRDEYCKKYNRKEYAPVGRRLDNGEDVRSLIRDDNTDTVEVVDEWIQREGVDKKELAEILNETDVVQYRRHTSTWLDQHSDDLTVPN